MPTFKHGQARPMTRLPVALGQVAKQRAYAPASMFRGAPRTSTLAKPSAMMVSGPYEGLTISPFGAANLAPQPMASVGPKAVMRTEAVSTPQPRGATKILGIGQSGQEIPTAGEAQSLLQQLRGSVQKAARVVRTAASRGFDVIDVEPIDTGAGVTWVARGQTPSAGPSTGGSATPQVDGYAMGDDVHYAETMPSGVTPGAGDFTVASAGAPGVSTGGALVEGSGEVVNQAPPEILGVQRVPSRWPYVLGAIVIGGLLWSASKK